MTCHGYRSRQRLGVGTSRRWDIVPHRIIRSKLRPLHRCSPVAAPVADIEDREIGETNKRPVSDISACPRDAGRLCLPDVRCDVLGIASALMMMMLVMPVGGQALADTAPLLPDTLTETYRGGEQHQGFRFSYPDSFVIAFDRTGSKTPKGNGEVALVSVGDFKKFITVTVFGSRMDDGEETPTSIVDVDTGYDVCIRPIVESETTMGFRVIREEMKNVSGVGVFDFEYDHSICRGEQIESSGGILRCIGNFGQDIPVQKKRVIGRAFFQPNQGSEASRILLTMMASMNADDPGLAENIGILTSIVESFVPL